MSVFTAARADLTSRVLSVLRIVAALLYIEHGTQKLFNYPPMANGHAMTIALGSMLGAAGILETFGGLAMLVGLFTRPVAFILCGEMAVAYFTQHFPRSFFPIRSGGEDAVLFCFVWLFFIFAGAGAWSVDAAIARAQGGAASAAVNA